MTADRTRGRFSDQPDFFDFSAVPGTYRQNTLRKQRRAAARLTSKSGQKRLVALFDALDRAHELWGSGGKADRDALQIALKAVAALVEASRENENQHYSYLFDLLADKLKPNQIVSQLRRAGERDSRSINIKAATAYLVHYLVTRGGQKRNVRMLCRWTAEILTDRGFPFSGKRARAKTPRSAEAALAAREKTIEHWRRDFLREGFGGSAGELFRRYRRRQPFQVSGSGASQEAAARQWWFDQLRKNRF